MPIGRRRAAKAALVALLGPVSLLLHGCEPKVQVVEKIQLGGHGGRTLTDLSDVIESLNFTIDDFSDRSGIHIRSVHVWNFQVPELKVSPLQHGDSRFGIQVSNVYADFHVGYLKAMAAGQAWEIETIVGVLRGEFSTVMTMDLKPPYAVDFKNCSAKPEVTVEHLSRMTWHTADYFGLGAIVNQKVKQALEDTAEKMFRQQVCGAYAFSKSVQRTVDVELKTQLGSSSRPRTPLENPYDWHDSRILNWMELFNEHAHKNRFSIKGTLDPFLTGLGTPEGYCLLGPGCRAQVPDEVVDLFTRRWNTSDGKTFNLTVDNLELRLVDFSIPTVKLPQLDEQDHQAIGFDVAVAPLSLKLQGDVVVKSDAYSASCDIRKRTVINLLFSRVSAQGSFLLQLDRDLYNALAPDQQASLACTDSIMTDFSLQRFLPHIGLQHIGISVSPDEDKNTTERLVRGLQEIADKLLVTGIRNAGNKIDDFLSAKAFDFISSYVNSKEGISGLATSLGQPLGSCPCAPSVLEALGWAIAAGLAFATSGALLAWGTYDPKAARAPAWLLRQGSLAAQPLTQPRWQLSVPMFAVGCILLYIESNAGVAAVMTVFLSADGSPDVEVHRLTEFGVVKSVWDLWDAEMRGLAALLFTFSVVFPYVKLALCLVSWLLPLAPDCRRRLLRVLNALARWSLLDAYVLMTLMGLGSLETRMQHGGISVSVFIDPRPSFVSFLVATILSFVLGEFILHCHEQSFPEAKPPNTSGEGIRTPGVLMVLLSLLLMLIASNLDITSFEVQGLIGWFLNFLADDTNGNKFSFSLLGLGAKLWRVTSDTHRVEALMMQVIYFLSALVMNVVFAVGVCAYATFRVQGDLARRIRSILLVIFACSAADVFAFGVIFTVIETRQGSFVPTPGWLRQQVEQIVRPRVDMPGASNDIIQIVPRVEIGAWLLAAGAFVFALGGHGFLEHVTAAEPSEADIEHCSAANEFGNESSGSDCSTKEGSESE